MVEPVGGRSCINAMVLPRLVYKNVATDPPPTNDTLFIQKSPDHREVGFPRWHTQQTDIATGRLNWPKGQISENINRFQNFFRG